MNPMELSGPIDYSRYLGLRAADLSSNAYCEPSILSKNGYKYINHDGYELQAIYTDNAIAFRGSSNLENWMLNLDTIKTDF